MKLDVLKIDGTPSGKSVELDQNVFGIEPNDHAVYLDVVQYLAGYGNDLIRGERLVQQDIGVVVALLVPLVAGFRHPEILPVPVEGVALPEVKRRTGTGGLAQRELNAA